MQKLAKQYDVIILGAGAAGLFCAFNAAQRGRSVLVLEKANKVGKKILMSGGGRCNFTNYSIEPENFLSNNPHFCKSALNQYTQWDFIALADQYGIDYTERKHGQLFCTHSAKDILAMLLSECDKAGVQIQTHCNINSINHTPNQYSVNVTNADNDYNIICESLVVATGALSIPTLGGSDFGYHIASQFNLPLIERRAGLVPFMFSDKTKALCERLAGVSTAIVASCNGQAFNEDMLFTHRGVSGPAILQISNYWKPGDTVCINLMPQVDATQWLLQQKAQRGKSRISTLLMEYLGKSLIKELQKLWWPQYSETAIAQINDQSLKQIAQQLNNWNLKPSATEGYRTAEVTLGGVNTNAISSKTFEVKQQAGLYFIGEVLDVTGHLGGYNFQWAWSSGYCAGQNV